MTSAVDIAMLAVFIPTFFFVSVTPGMCMTLAMTLGMSIGVRRSLHMMWGELIGVGLVSLASVVGVAAIMLNYPGLFSVLKYVGGAYLFYLGVQMWLSKGKMAIPDDLSAKGNTSAMTLAMQGFVTAIANERVGVYGFPAAAIYQSADGNGASAVAANRHYSADRIWLFAAVRKRRP